MEMRISKFDCGGSNHRLSKFAQNIRSKCIKYIYFNFPIIIGVKI